MVKSPCMNCTNRKVPKTCEKDCELWVQFKKEKDAEKEAIFNAKELKFRIDRSIYNEKKRRYNK